MKLALSLMSESGGRDVLVDVDATTTVGELARALFPRLAAELCSDDELGLSVGAVAHGRRNLTPEITIGQSGLCAGSVVSPIRSGLPSPPRDAIATLRVHDGPDAPATFRLGAGRTCIGRGSASDVRLTDPLVSKCHASIRIGAAVEIFDESSTNGVVISGRAMGAAVLRDGDRAELGDSSISVTVDTPCPSTDVRENVVAFNRSPRLSPRYAGVTLVAPEPPRPPNAPRFPIATLVAPLVFAAIVFGVTRSTLSILFVALSPVMMLGTWIETRSSNRRQLAAAVARFRTALAELAEQLSYAQGLERSGRRQEHPSVVDVVEAVELRSQLMWTRRPEHDWFGDVRLGVGSQPSRNIVDMPSSNATLPGLWRELLETVERFRAVPDVPVVTDLRECGALGVAGHGSGGDAVARGVLAQLVGLHSPAELRLAAFAPAKDWDWLKWLPHTDVEMLAGDAGQAIATIGALEQLVSDRGVGRSGDEPADRQPFEAGDRPLMVVFVHDDTPADRARLVQLAERGPPFGVHVVWYAATVERLPASCRAFVEASAQGDRAGFVETGTSVDDLRLEPLGAAASVRFARQLGPLVDAGALPDTSTDLPASVALVDLIGHDAATEPAAIADVWRAASTSSARDVGLPAVVGRTVDGTLRLDLRTQGPHALVGGTTGSGKSEFLQTWIVAMAATRGPDRVTFLLVDYKGGAAFADCVDLPHCVGLVTDLTPHLVRRALTSLDAEVRHREELLQHARAKDLLELERRGDPACPPSLVIVVDEFAALVADVPGFVEGVVNIAQRGRSLGLHLVLATQRPAGVINDNVRANTNLRVALRMADATDSIDVIGSDVAASFDADTPGRAAVTMGSGRSVPFQAAYAGGVCAGRSNRPAVGVVPFRFGGAVPAPPAPVDAVGGPSDISRIVRSMGLAAADLESPRRPWLPELADLYDIEALPTDTGRDSIVFGVSDDAARQAQPIVAFEPDVDGNMAAFGTGGAGKSCFLRTVALAAGLRIAADGPCHVYGIDFGSRGLEALSALPHVGAVVNGDDHERLQRLLRMLGDLTDDRASRFARAQAATIAEYRDQTGDRHEPRVVLLVDGVGAFRAEYEGGPRTAWWDRFSSLAAAGRGLGLHVVMTADRPASIPSALASTVQRRLVLRLANEMDYALVDVPSDAYGPRVPAGRGYLDGRQVQVAVIGGHGDLRRQVDAVERCASQLRSSGVVGAPPIASLPTRVTLGSLTPPSDGLPPIGIDDEALAPIGVETNGVFLVAGPPRSGVSSAIATIAVSIHRADPDSELILLGCRRSPLASTVPWVACAAGVTEVADLAIRLTERLPEAEGRRVVVVIEALDELLNTDADAAVQSLLRVSREMGLFFVVVGGETSGLGGSWPLLQAAKSYRCGIVLQPDQIDGDALFKTPFPRIGRTEFPPGRGLMVQSGRVRKIQVALPE